MSMSVYTRRQDLLLRVHSANVNDMLRPDANIDFHLGNFRDILHFVPGDVVSNFPAKALPPSPLLYSLFDVAFSLDACNGVG